MIWITCEGKNKTDIDNIGPIQYIPQQGFPSYYYPYTNQKGYLEPIIAVKFERPKCKWLTNVKKLEETFRLKIYFTSNSSGRVDQYWVQSMGSQHHRKKISSLQIDGQLKVETAI